MDSQRVPNHGIDKYSNMFGKFAVRTFRNNSVSTCLEDVLLYFFIGDSNFFSKKILFFFD